MTSAKGASQTQMFFLAFDHRGLFQRGLFGWDGLLTDKQTAQVADAKHLIYEGLEVSAMRGAPAASIGLLVDEQFGAQVAREAGGRGFTLAMPVEQSDGDEFDFEFGEQFGEHIEDFDPSFAKVLVRLDPDGDADLNARQLERLHRLSRWLGDHGRRFLFELIVVATEAQLAGAGGDKERYERELRPELIERSMRTILAAGIDVDVWKLEGLDDPADAQRLSDLARSDGRDDVGLVLLGAGAPDDRVCTWLHSVAPIEGWVGFAIGRSIWWQPVADFLAGGCTRAAAAAQIADNYERFVAVYREAAGR